jgi:hypothetical protein
MNKGRNIWIIARILTRRILHFIDYNLHLQVIFGEYESSLKYFGSTIMSRLKWSGPKETNDEFGLYEYDVHLEL